MANEEHLAILEHGTKTWWNKWRKRNPHIRPDLKGALLIDIDLSEADLSHTNLSHAHFMNTDLGKVDFSDADLSYADLSLSNLDGANFDRANLRGAGLSAANLDGASLFNADLSNANLYRANLDGANFRKANLQGVEMSQATLQGADLSGANLYAVQALSTKFRKSILTGACIKDWHIGVSTVLEEIVCEYFYQDLDGTLTNADFLEKAEIQKPRYLERRSSDPNKTFVPGEFISLVQKSLSTVDLIFTDGIDWKAFFASFQAVQAQYADRHLSIQAIERKDNAFVIRLEIDADADKGAIEHGVMAPYAERVKQCERIIDLQGRQLEDYRELLREQRQQNTELYGGIIKTLADQQQQPKTVNNLYHPKFGGGFAADGGMAIGGTFNDFSQNIEQNLSEIDRLVRSLHSLSQTLPTTQQTEAIEHLNDLQAELKTPDKRKPSRLKASLAALLVIGGAIANTANFANTVYELSDKLGVPLERVQPAQQPSTVDVPVIKPESK